MLPENTLSPADRVRACALALEEAAEVVGLAYPENTLPYRVADAVRLEARELALIADAVSGLPFPETQTALHYRFLFAESLLAKVKA